MGGPSPPGADSVSNKQLQFGLKAAKGQQELNQVNQVTPYGRLTYSQSGTNPDGTPRFTATSTLNRRPKELKNALLESGTASARTAGDIIGANAGQWAAGPDMDETGITKAIMGWGHDYLDPGFERAAASEDAKLANQGIMPGSEAYNNAVTNRNRGKNDAYTQLLLQGQGQAMSAAEAKYMDPLRAISVLSTGQQPGMGLAQTPQANVSAPDYATASNNQYNAQKSNSDALMSGLFKIPQTLLGGWASGGL